MDEIFWQLKIKTDVKDCRLSVYGLIP